MKIISIGVLLCLCLVSSQARPGIRSPRPKNVNDNDRFPAEISHFGLISLSVRCYEDVFDCTTDHYHRVESWLECCDQLNGRSFADESQSNRCLVW